MTAEVFVSHSSRDRDATEAVVAALRARGFDSLWVDFDPIDGIPPGRDWEQEIYRGLRRCDAVLVVDTEAWRGSKWCFAEISLARSLGKTVIAVRRPVDSDHPPPVSAAQSITLEDFSEASFEPVFRELAVLGGGALRTFRWDPARAPYPGLSPLQSEDAGVFFGRRAETRKVIDLLERVVRYREKSAVLLVGPSGCGKSSLLRAGVLPQLAQRSGWRIVGPVLPDAPSLEGVRAELVSDGGGRVLVAVDQIDEARESRRSAALLELFDHVDALRGRAVILGTVRVDALAALDERLAGRATAVERVVVGALTREDYRAIIEGPAAAAGVDLEPGLIDTLLADVAASGARADAEGRISSDSLPLLAVTLRRLWDDGMTLDAYRRTNGLAGAIEDAADLVIAASGLDALQLEKVRRAFMGMVRVDRDGRFTRRPLRLNDDVPREVRSILDRFVAEGLLVAGAASASVELAHEALIRDWPTLASWAEEDREDLVRLERFELALARWREQSSATLDELALAEAKALAAQGFSALLEPDAQSLVETSRREIEEAAAREREREHALRVSESLRLASEARQASTSEPMTALLLAWEGLLWDRNELSESVFREALARLPAPVMALRSPREGYEEWPATGFAANGEAVFAAGRRDGIVQVWDLQGALNSRFQVLGDGRMTATAVAAGIVSYRDTAVRLHNLDGRLLHELTLDADAHPNSLTHQIELRAASDGTCLLRSGEQYWLLQTAEGLRVIRRLDIDESGPFLGRVFDVVLDDTGSAVITVCSDGAWRLWSAEGHLRAEIRSSAGGGTPASAAFLADAIATGTQQGQGALWTRDGMPLGVFREPGELLDLYVRAVHPDGQVFATCMNRTGAVELWNAAGDRLSTLEGHGGHVWAAEFSGDGRLLATGSDDRTVRVWNWREQHQLLELHGHESTVNWIGLHPLDSNLLLSRDHAGAVRLWRLQHHPFPAFRGHTDGIRAMVRTPHGLLTNAADRTARLWTEEGGSNELSGRLAAHTDSAALTIDQAGVARLWSLTGDTPACRCMIPGQSSSAAAAISADSTSFLLSAAGGDGLWSASGDLLARLASPDDPELDRVDRRIVGLGFNVDGRIVKASTHGMVWVWAPDGTLLQAFVPDRGSPDNLLSFALDPRQQFILLGARDRAALWTWAGDEVGSLAVGGYKVVEVAWSPDGSRIITIADNPSGRPFYIVELWSRDGDRIAVLDVPSADTVSPVRFDPASRYACVPGGGDVRIFDRDGERLGRVAGMLGTARSDVTLSPDGELVAVTFTDGTARIWSRAEKRQLMTLRIGKAARIAFSANGRRLLAGMPSGVIEQHAIDVGELFPAARSRVSRGLTPDEADRFGIAQPPRLRIDA